MDNKTEQLNKLFVEWEDSVPEYKGKFIKDGILNETKYNSAKSKILFLMKEPNNREQMAGDFREWWKNSISHTFPIRIAEWSYGLLNNFPPYDEIRDQSKLAHEAIQHIALANIKKSGGGGNSEYAMMKHHLTLNFGLLHKQINIINPEIIILGTSWQKLRNQIFPDIKWMDSGYDKAIGKHNQTKVIDFYHPSSRNAPAAAYSLLQNIVRSETFKSL